MLYRTIKTDTWRDPWFHELDWRAKLLFLYFLSNRSSKPGTYEISVSIIRFETGLSMTQITDALIALQPVVEFDPILNLATVNDSWKYVLSRRLKKGLWATLRRSVFKRDDFTCQYCGARGGRLECDHIVPLSRGGSNDPENLATSCRDCNQSKGARLIEEWT